MKAFDVACKTYWAMTQEALQTILEIAARENPLTPSAVAEQMGRPLDNTHTVTIRDGVATIPVNGPIMRYASLFTEISGATSIETLATDLHTALDNPAVAAIVLDIDSPGGTVAGTSELAGQVYAARGQKPIVAYVSDLGCSAAYWIASACDEIVVANTATVGSIGVVATMRDPKASSAKEVEFVSSQSPDKRPDISTERGRAKVQAHVDDLADIFVGAVAQHRGVSPEHVLVHFGQGGTFVGQKAVDAGLADAVGTYESTLVHARETASSSTFGSTAAAPVAAHASSQEHKPMADTPQAVELDSDTTCAENAGQGEELLIAAVVPTVSADEFDAMKRRLAALETERNEARAQAMLEAERVKALETENRRTELAALAADWHGETSQHVAILEQLTPDARAFYVETMNAQTAQVRESALFERKGIAGSEGTGVSAQEQLQALATSIRTENPTLSKERAYTEAIRRRPELYTQHVQSAPRTPVSE